MNRTLLTTLLVAGLVLSPAHASDTQSSADLLLRMSEAARNLDYDGVFIFTRGERMDVMRILHKQDANGEREKILSLTGHAREIIRNNNTITCIFPDTQQVVVESSRAQGLSARLPGRIDTLADYYEFMTTGEERIAGRDTWVVLISPRDNDRYGHQLWIDKESHLMLKSELLDEKGKPMETMMFTQIDVVDELADDLFNPTITGADYTRYQYDQWSGPETQDPVMPGEDDWQVTWMPAGFRLSVHDEKPVDDSGSMLDHMIYTDGVSTLSVFIEAVADRAMAESGATNVGGVNVYSMVVGEHQVTAVGEVPEPTVRRVVESVVAGNRP